MLGLSCLGFRLLAHWPFARILLPNHAVKQVVYISDLTLDFYVMVELCDGTCVMVELCVVRAQVESVQQRAYFASRRNDLYLQIIRMYKCNCC